MARGETIDGPMEQGRDSGLKLAAGGPQAKRLVGYSIRVVLSVAGQDRSQLEEGGEWLAALVVLDFPGIRV